MAEHSTSLYVHVPFCARKCRYCDFYSEAGRGGSIAPRVVEETLRQVDALCAALPALGPVETVYVGGGTPSVLAAADLERLLGRLAALRPVEWTVEANPESLGEPFLAACAAAGVTRLSVGLQSMDDRLLRLLGRPGSREDNLRALSLIERRWSGALGVDLIAGIPGQTVEGLGSDVAMAIERGRGHVSLYSLTVEPGTALERLIARGTIRPNPRELDEELWLRGRSALEAAGLRGYEVSNFALPGRECRHNLRYWRLEPYAGAGPGAVSTLPRRVAERLTGAPLPPGGPVVRLANPRALAPFLRGASARWGMGTEVVSARSFLLETLMMGLRTADGVAADSFGRRFGAEIDSLLPGLWAGWVERGLAEEPRPRIRLTERGRLILDRLLAEAAGRIRDLPEGSVGVEWP